MIGQPQIAETADEAKGALNMAAFLKGRLGAILESAGPLASKEVCRSVDAAIDLETAKLLRLRQCAEDHSGPLDDPS